MESNADCDTVIENQRGVSLLGYPFFSPKLLLPRVDPSNFQILDREKGTLHDIGSNHRRIGDMYPLEYNERGGRWLVDMRVNNSDDQGWVYSWGFRRGRWRDRKGLVRRRIWVRHTDNMKLVNLVPMDVSASNSVTNEYQTAEDDKNLTLVENLRRQLLDRYRFEILEGCDKQIFQDKELCREIENCFQYMSSKRKFQEWLKQK